MNECAISYAAGQFYRVYPTQTMYCLHFIEGSLFIEILCIILSHKDAAFCSLTLVPSTTFQTFGGWVNGQTLLKEKSGGHTRTNRRTYSHYNLDLFFLFKGTVQWKTFFLEIKPMGAQYIDFVNNKKPRSDCSKGP